MSELYQNGPARATRAEIGQRTPGADRQRRPSKPLKRIRAADPAPISATDPDERRFCGIPYADRSFYFDTLYFQSKSLLGAEDQWWLEAVSKEFRILWDGQIVRDRSGKLRMINVYRPYRFQIEIHVPKREALEFLAHVSMLGDLRLVAAHPARDFTFCDPKNKRAMLDFFNEHWVQPYQRKERGVVRFENGGGSSGRRSRGYYETHYASEPCRNTGIVDCFHIEGRHHGKAALQKIGIHSPFDLLEFDHQGYWREMDAKCLKGIDVQRLGQFHRNRKRGSRSRKANGDIEVGNELIRRHGFDWLGNICVQQFLQNYGSGPFLRSADELGLSDEKNEIGCIDIKGGHL